jgi:hypothetical protein
MTIMALSMVTGVAVGCLGLLACSPRETANPTPPPTTPATTVAVPATTSTPSPSARWTVVVCSSRSGPVTLHAGPSKDDNEVFVTWRQGDQRVHALPQRVQNLSEVYLRAAKPDDGKPVELCVLFDGHPKKRLDFRGGVEDGRVKSSDTDQDECRCVQ